MVNAGAMWVRRFLLLAFSIFCVQSLSAVQLTIFAAVSLTEALTEIAPLYKQVSGNTFQFNFAGSNDLARQINAGAAADLFFSADEAKMDYLEQQNRLAPKTRRSLLSNTLVIVIPKDASSAIASPTDLPKAVHHLALANPDAVPAGIYAKQYLMRLFLWENLRPMIVPTENVRACLAAVETGNADAGFVYKTDASISKRTKIAYEVPVAEGPPISYPIAVIKDSQSIEEATKAEDFLASAQAMMIFQKYGFAPLH
jgi:molybdate transport system substrate-binding protein